MAEVVVARGREGRLARGHVWVYDTQIAQVEGNPQPGDVVDVVTAHGALIGRGYFNPRSRIQVRLLTREDEPIDREFFARRLDEAIAYRRRFYPLAQGVRLVFSEGDRLPGLIVDRFADVVVVQFLTLGMDVRRKMWTELLIERLEPRAIVERSDVPSRRLEGLEPRVEVLFGAVQGPVAFEENGLLFEADVLEGHKTGFFLDQRENRQALRPLAPGARVLDAFAYTGSFALFARSFGAASVMAVEQSHHAVQRARRQAERNQLGDIEWVEANAFDELRRLDQHQERFDLIILDPPAFARTRRSVEGALRGYKEINLRAWKLLAPGGFLVTCSCSQHVAPDQFFDVVAEAAEDARREWRLVESRTQAFDHPILPSVPETLYLKCMIAQAL
ncbi:MAG: class I SAM-dependent rRNA methyltransferase [Limnochordaceae bacterium]|nr:class I SAM-dependent rRNA methyltransferase [Limnochordaceae bacterium]